MDPLRFSGGREAYIKSGMYEEWDVHISLSGEFVGWDIFGKYNLPRVTSDL